MSLYSLLLALLEKFKNRNASQAEKNSNSINDPDA